MTSDIYSISNCIWWNCAPALWDAEVRRAIRDAKHPQLSTHRVTQWIPMCFQHVLRCDKYHVLQGEEAPWLR